ncbi:MAG: hypothetical protein RLZZ245_3713 [Verrucomicrobiota bacterium]|jgi:hypothetical protein
MSIVPSGWVVDWQAWATLAAGGLAVAAALAVGVMQTKLLSRQTEISSELADIERAKIRFELFEKRYEFVTIFYAFVGRIRSKTDIWNDEDDAFVAATRQAEYLFPASMRPLIEDLWDTSVAYQDAGDNLASKDQAVRDRAIADRNRLRRDLDDLVLRFSEMFDAEIRPFD